MNDLFLSVYFRLKEMPLFLRLIFIVSICGIFFVMFSIINIDNYQIYGRKVSYQEWWLSGIGLVATITGLLLFMTGIGIYKKKKWSKVTFLSTLFIALILNPKKGESIYMAAIWLLVFGSYLFLKKSVRNYFEN